MSKKFIDFDEAWKEEEDEPVVVVMFGKDWTLPSQIPAKVVLESQRLAAENDQDTPLSKAQMEIIMSKIVPEEILGQWLDLGLGSVRYQEVILKLIALYRGLEDKGEGEGEADAPEDGAEIPA